MRKGDPDVRREVTLEEISDGKLYGLNDMVKADCHDCEGCCDCCRGMGDTVILDPLDVHRLSVGLELPVEQLLDSCLELGICDGNILPHLRMADGEEERCRFLNAEGRCSIHAFRPGICRLFPLGRFYENQDFRYFLQVHECSRKNRIKVKVKKWLDVPQAETYHAFVRDWHYFLLDVQEVLYDASEEPLIRDLNLYVLNRFYIQPYDREQDFYREFYQRLQEGRGLLHQLSPEK